MDENNIQDIHETDEPKAAGKFKRFMKFVFVKNVGYKAIALVMGFLTWIVISVF